jgi:hypothetical protein
LTGLDSLSRSVNLPRQWEMVVVFLVFFMFLLSVRFCRHLGGAASQSQYFTLSCLRNFLGERPNAVMTPSSHQVSDRHCLAGAVWRVPVAAIVFHSFLPLIFSALTQLIDVPLADRGSSEYNSMGQNF